MARFARESRRSPQRLLLAQPVSRAFNFPEWAVWLLRADSFGKLKEPLTVFTAVVERELEPCSWTEIASLCSTHGVAGLVINSCVTPNLLQAIAADCEERGCRVHVETRRADAPRRAAPVIDDVLAATALQAPIGRQYAKPRGNPTISIARRAADIAASLALSTICAPFLLVAAIAILAESPGSALFAQTRIGERGRPFRMWKLRTMFSTAEPLARSPTEADTKVTRIGRLLRATGLDEIPQLLNILRGEMTLVGPRPEMPFIAQRYTPLQSERLAVRPGLTGLWQLRGDRHAAIHDQIEFDLHYIAFRTAALDFRLLLETVAFCARGCIGLFRQLCRAVPANDSRTQRSATDHGGSAPHV